MSKNCAIIIGIDSYINLQHLKYARQDAEAMKDWCQEEAAFSKVFLFSDNSPPIPAQGSSIPTQPTFGHIRRFFRAQFERPLLNPGDNLWFFFAGHGRRHADRDYLMLSDSDPGDIEHTAIPISYFSERLRRWGADNVLLFIDACRDEGTRSGLGIGYERHQGLVTFYSCSASEKSYEIDELRHGSFTAALLGGLQRRGENNCATVERLQQYLSYQVPLLNRQYKRGQQTPYATAEPATKLHLILLPSYASLKDIEAIKIDALNAEVEGKYDLARQLWIRVNAASQGTDMAAIGALSRLQQQSLIDRLKHTRYLLRIYDSLESLLAQNKWKEADQLTGKILLMLAEREREKSGLIMIVLNYYLLKKFIELISFGWNIVVGGLVFPCKKEFISK